MEKILRIDMGAQGGPRASIEPLGKYAGLGGRGLTSLLVADEVDPTCHQDLGCSVGPYNVVWAGDAFLVIYFVTVHLGEPTETTEMRMVRLVPST